MKNCELKTQRQLTPRCKRGAGGATVEAGDNQAAFLNYFNINVKQPILDNPLMLRKVKK